MKISTSMDVINPTGHRCENRSPLNWLWICDHWLDSIQSNWFTALIRAYYSINNYQAKAFMSVLNVKLTHSGSIRTGHVLHQEITVHLFWTTSMIQHPTIALHLDPIRCDPKMHEDWAKLRRHTSNYLHIC